MPAGVIAERVLVSVELAVVEGCHVPRYPHRHRLSSLHSVAWHRCRVLQHRETHQSRSVSSMPVKTLLLLLRSLKTAYLEDHVACDEVAGLHGDGGAVRRPVPRSRAVERYRRHRTGLAVERDVRPGLVDEDLLPVDPRADLDDGAGGVAGWDAFDGVRDRSEVSGAVLAHRHDPPASLRLCEEWF